jgi:hypothetical protein
MYTRAMCSTDEEFPCAMVMIRTGMLRAMAPGRGWVTYRERCEAELTMFVFEYVWLYNATTDEMRRVR